MLTYVFGLASKVTCMNLFRSNPSVSTSASASEFASALYGPGYGRLAALLVQNKSAEKLHKQRTAWPFSAANASAIKMSAPLNVGRQQSAENTTSHFVT